RVEFGAALNSDAEPRCLFGGTRIWSLSGSTHRLEPRRIRFCSANTSFSSSIPKVGIPLTQLITKRKSCGAGALARGQPFVDGVLAESKGYQCSYCCRWEQAGSVRHGKVSVWA